MADRGLFDQALAAARKAGTDSEVVAELALYPARLGKFDQALSLVKSLEDPFTRGDSLLNIAEIQVSQKATTAAATTLRDAKKAWEESEDADDWINYRRKRLAVYHLHAGNFKQFRKLLNGFIDHQKMLIRKVGPTDEPFELEDAVDSTLESLAYRLTKNGRLDVAMSVANQLPKGTSSQGFTMQDIAMERIKRGDVDRALAMALAATDVYFSDDILLAVVKRKSTDGELDQAAKLAEAIGREEKRVRGLLHVARCQHRAGQTAQAEQLQHEAEDVIAKLSDLATQAELSALLASAQWESGKKESSKRSLEKAIEIARRVDHTKLLCPIQVPIIHCSPFDEIVKSQIEIGDFSGAKATLAIAERTFVELNKNGLRVSNSFSDIAVRLIDARDLDGAIERIQNWDSDPKPVRIYIDMAEHLAKKGDVQTAVTKLEPLIPKELRAKFMMTIAHAILERKHPKHRHPLDRLRGAFS